MSVIGETIKKVVDVYGFVTTDPDPVDCITDDRMRCLNTNRMDTCCNAG